MTPDPGRLEARITLPAGRTHSRLVRIGDTVRRPIGPWTPTVHAFLTHLGTAGFIGVPGVLGLDDEGREILTYLDGEVPHDPEWEPGMAGLWPPERRGLDVLDAIGALLRSLHEASAGFVPEDPVWRLHDAPMRPDEIVCHGDIGPWNTVYRDGTPVAFIDWDGAKPCLPILEFAQVVWEFVPLGPDPTGRNGGFPSAEELPTRVARICHAYGVSDPARVRWALKEYKQRSVEVVRFWPVDTLGAARALERFARDLRWLAEYEDLVVAALS